MKKSKIIPVRNLESVLESNRVCLKDIFYRRQSGGYIRIGEKRERLTPEIYHAVLGLYNDNRLYRSFR